MNGANIKDMADDVRCCSIETRQWAANKRAANKAKSNRTAWPEDSIARLEARADLLEKAAATLAWMAAHEADIRAFAAQAKAARS